VAQATVTSGHVITGGGRRRRWTAEAVDRMEIVSGSAVVRIGTEWCRGAATGAEGAAGLGVMRYRVGLGSLGGLGHGGARLAKP
jgi:hypothetical protein